MNWNRTDDGWTELKGQAKRHLYKPLNDQFGLGVKNKRKHEYKLLNDINHIKTRVGG